MIALEDLDWSDDALLAIQKRAEHGGTFDAYDLTEAGLRKPPHPNMWGSVFRAAAELGIIHHEGWRKSRRPSRAGGVCSYWAGVR